MPFGENVGQAYVRITADGSSMDEDIRDMLNDAGKAYDTAGDEHSKRYAKALEKNLKSGPTEKSVRKAFDDQLAKVKYGEKFFKGKAWDDFTNTMVEKHGHIGAEAAARLERDFNEGLIDSKGLKSRMKNIDLLVTESTKEVVKGEEESGRRLAAQTKKNHEAVIREFEGQNAQQKRLLNAHIAALAEDARRQLAITKSEERLGAAHLGEMQRLRKLDITRQQAYVEQERHIRKDIADLQEKAARSVAGDPEAPNRRQLLADLFNQRVALERLGPGWEKERNSLRDHNHELALTSPLLASLNHNLDGTSKKIGKAFGKGSRNDFLNFIGSVVGGIARLPASIVGAVGSLGRLRKAITLAMDDTFIRTGSKFLATLAGLGTAAGQLGTAFAVGGSAILGLTGLIGPLIALLSLAAGVVVALAGSIGFALAGAVGVAGAVLLPFAAAIGVVAVAFAGLSKAQKKALKVDFKPVTTELGKLRKAAQDGIFKNMDKAAKNLAPAVRTLTPLFQKVGVAIGDVVVQLAKSANSKEFQGFVSSMTKFLPGAIKSLGRSLASAFGGFGGIIRGMIPFMKQVLGYIEQITGKFNIWANSAGGQNSIALFFERSRQSLIKFSGFLRSVGGLFAVLLTQGRKAGDDIFGSMTKSIDGWTEKLRRNPDILKDWFTSAKNFAREVGKAAVAVGHLFDALDTKGSRKAITSVFSGIAKAVNAIADAINDLPPGMGKRLVEVGLGLLAIGKALKIIAAAKTSLTIIRGLATALGLLGPAGAIAGAGAGEAAAGIAGVSTAALALPAAVAILGGFATKYALAFDKISHSQDSVTASLKELGDTGKTNGFGDVSKSYGSMIPIVNKLSRGLLDLKTPVQDIGFVLHSAAYTDLPKIFAPGAVKAVGQMDVALSHMSRNDASKAFAGIVKEGAKAHVSLEDVRKLFPKFTAQQKKWDAASGAIMTDQSKRLTAANSDWFLLGARMDALPRAVTTIMSQPGMVTSLGDIKTLQTQYHLTPDKLLTVIAASGAAETIGDVKRVRTEFKLTPQQVTTLLTLTGQVKTLADVNRYTKALNLTPKLRETLMRVLGIKEALPSVKEIADKLKGLPPEVISRIEMHGGDLSKKQLEDIVLSSGKLNGKQIKAIVQLLGIKISKTELQNLIDLAKIANARKIKMKADLDTSKFDAARRRTMAAIQALDAKKPKPKADLDTGRFEANRKRTMAGINNIDIQKPKPHADLDTSKFDAGKARVGTGIADLDRKNANPHVDLSGAGAAVALAHSVANALLGIHDRHVGVYITTHHDAGAQRNDTGPAPGKTAMGGVFNYAQTRLIGEAGAEAVVPLNRALSQVDPAVRWLSAIAQGKLPGMAGGGVVGSGRTVNVGGVTVVTPNSDARAVASEVINKLVAVGY